MTPKKKEETSTEVAVKESSVPAVIHDTGLEGIEADDMFIPRLTLCEALSNPVQNY